MSHNPRSLHARGAIGALVASVLCSTAAPAWALVPMGYSGFSTPPIAQAKPAWCSWSYVANLCTPTPTRCLDATWYDQAKALPWCATCVGDIEQACVDLLSEQAGTHAQQNGLATTTVVHSDGTTAQVPQDIAAGAHPDTLLATQGAAQRMEQLAIDGAELGGLSPSEQAKRAAWAANGAAVESFEEYAYERFLPYGQFLDETTGLGAMEAADVAFGTWWSDPTALASRMRVAEVYCTKPSSCMKYLFRDRHDDPVPVGGVMREIPALKNPFFAMPADLVDDPELVAALQKGQTWQPAWQPKGIFDWHYQRYLAAKEAGIAPAAFDKARSLVATFQDTLQAYLDLEPKVPTGKALMDLQAMAAEKCLQGYAAQGGFQDGAFSQCMAEETGDISMMQSQLAYLEDTLRDLFSKAVALGCLQTDTATPCDWQPSLLLDDLDAAFGAPMRGAELALRGATRGDFDALHAASFHLPDGTLLPEWKQAYGTSEVDLTAFPKLAETYVDWVNLLQEAMKAWAGTALGALAAANPDLVSPDGTVEPPYLNASWSWHEGSDSFAVGIEAAVQAGLRDAKGELVDTPEELKGYFDFDPQKGACAVDGCNLLPFGKVDVSATGRVFGEDLSILDASAELYAVGGKASVSVAGKELFNFDKGKKLPASIVLWNDTYDWDKTLVSGSTVIPVAGIPISLEGSLAVAAGLEAKATAQATCSPVGAGIEGTLRPFAKAVGNAKVGVGIPDLADLYVEGKVDLLDLSLPTSASAKIARHNCRLDLDLDASSKLDLGALDGSVEVGLELLFVDVASTKVFSWEGVHESWPLFDASYSVNLVDLGVLASMQ